MNKIHEKLAGKIKAAFDNTYDDEHEDAALKIYFYPFAALFFSDEEWDSFMWTDETTVRRDKVQWIVTEGGNRLGEFVKSLKLGKNKWLSVIVYGMALGEGDSNILDFIYHVDEDGGVFTASFKTWKERVYETRTKPRPYSLRKRWVS